MGIGKILLGAGSALILALLGIAFAIPREVRVQRSVRIDASPETAYALVEDLRRHDLWMPWGALPSRPQVVFGAVEQGPGATYFWIGDHRTHGTLMLEALDPHREILASVDLASIDKAQLLFRFEPAEGSGVEVTAELHKDLGYNPLRRYLRGSHRRDAEAMLDEALPRLKKAAEALPPTRVEQDSLDAIPAI
jgi:hypothetical protein